jgi:hypothetical protein
MFKSFGTIQSNFVVISISVYKAGIDALCACTYLSWVKRNTLNCEESHIEKSLALLYLHSLHDALELWSLLLIGISKQGRLALPKGFFDIWTLCLPDPTTRCSLFWKVALFQLLLNWPRESVQLWLDSYALEKVNSDCTANKMEMT